MVRSSIMTVLPHSPVYFADCKILNHFQIFDCIPDVRLHGSQQYKELRLDRKMRNIMRVASITGANSTGVESKDSSENRLLIDCRPDQLCVSGGVVALGKFDALHIGHRALAIQASNMGPPFLLSFSGMAEVLGWEKKLSIVAPCDRKRIMSLWATDCGGIAPQEYHMEFAKVRSLSPHDFIEKLAFELRVHGVVAGANYRFGYKAAGDASDLVQLGNEYGLKVSIVDPVMDKSGNPALVLEEMKENSREKGQISSTRVRKALSAGNTKRVAELLGRKHRLVLVVDDCRVKANKLVVPLSNLLNQPPRDGIYSCKIYLRLGECNGMGEESGRHGEVRIGITQVAVTLCEGSFDVSLKEQTYVGLDLQDRIFE